MKVCSAGAAALIAAAAAFEPIAAQPASVPQRIAAQEFGALPFFSDPAISPDGSKIVAQATLQGQTSVLLIDTTTAKITRRVPIPDRLGLLWTSWAGNKLLLSLSVPSELYGVEFRSSRLMLLDPATGLLYRLGEQIRSEDGDDVIHIDPAGRYVLVSAAKRIFEYPAVWRIDLQSRQSVEILKPKDHVWSWYADSKGVVRAGLGLEGKRYWLLYREHEQAKFRRILKGKIGAEDDDDNIEAYIPVADSDIGYAVADKGTGRFGIYQYDFAKDTLGAAVFEHPQVDVDSWISRPRTGGLLGVSYVDDRDRVHWLDSELKKTQAKIDRALPGAINRIISMSDTGNHIIVQSTAAHDPGTYFLYDAAKRTMSPLAKPYASLDGLPLATVESVQYAARDGLSIPAYLTLPLGRAASKLPLILMPHGGPFLRDKWEYDPWVQFLANRGYAVLQPNFRGSTGYGKAFVEAGHGQWGRKMQDDLDDGVRWLVAQGKVDPSRVCIMGASYGGYAAMWAAARNPEIYRCAISYAGISDVGAMLSYDRKLFVAGRYYRDWREQVRGAGRLDIGDVSPLNAASRISIPLLIAHGKLDDRVPYSQSVKLREALQRANKPHEFYLYDKDGHGFSSVESSVDFLKRVDAFLARHNPAN